MGQGEWQAALAVNEEGRGHYPDDAELLFQAGQLYQQKRRLSPWKRPGSQMKNRAIKYSRIRCAKR